VINLIGPTVPESEPYYKASIEITIGNSGEFRRDQSGRGIEERKPHGGEYLRRHGRSGSAGSRRAHGWLQVGAGQISRIQGRRHPGRATGTRADRGDSRALCSPKYADKGGIQGAFRHGRSYGGRHHRGRPAGWNSVGVDKNGLVVVASHCFKIGTVNVGKARNMARPLRRLIRRGVRLPLLEKALAGQEIPKRSLMTEGRITKEHARQVPGILQRRVRVACGSSSSRSGQRVGLECQCPILLWRWKCVASPRRSDPSSRSTAYRSLCAGARFHALVGHNGAGKEHARQDARRRRRSRSGRDPGRGCACHH